MSDQEPTPVNRANGPFNVGDPVEWFDAFAESAPTWIPTTIGAIRYVVDIPEAFDGRLVPLNVPADELRGMPVERADDPSKVVAEGLMLLRFAYWLIEGTDQVERDTGTFFVDANQLVELFYESGRHLVTLGDVMATEATPMERADDPSPEQPMPPEPDQFLCDGCGDPISAQWHTDDGDHFHIECCPACHPEND